MAAKPTVDVVEILRKPYVEIRNKRIEETLLEKIGLTTKEFMSPDIVNMVIDGMSKYNYGLALLIAGLDESGVHGNALKKYRNSSKL